MASLLRKMERRRRGDGRGSSEAGREIQPTRVRLFFGSVRVVKGTISVCEDDSFVSDEEGSTRWW